MNPILQLDNISYAYEEHHKVLSNLSLCFYPGEKVAILGNNGAGKSTLFLCCNGVLTPTEGRVLLKNQEIGSKRKDRLPLRKAVGLVFQDPDNQILAGTVEAEISFGPMNLKLPVNQVRQRVDQAISDFNLEAFRLRAPQYLSGGEKKRVSIADVLAMEPDLLLLDEPASSLDPVNRRLLEDHLEQLSQQGYGLVVATHDLDFAWRWADRILLFHQGVLQADGTAEEIFAQEELIKLCGLEQPTLYQVGKKLGRSPLPRSVDDL